MSTKKSKSFAFSPKQMVLPAVLSILFLVGVFAFAASNRTQPITTVKLSPTPAPQVSSEPEVVEIIEDGVYTNNEYGFKYQYNHELFSRYDDFYNGQFRSFRTQDTGSVTGISIGFPFDEKFSEIYKDGMERCRNESFNIYYLDNEKIWESDRGCATSSVFNYKGDGLEPSWGYDGYFETPKGIVAISLNAMSLDEMNNLIGEFNLIINSFRLLN